MTIVATALPDQVGRRHGLGHEAVDTDDQCDTNGGDVPERLQPGGQRDQRGTADTVKPIAQHDEQWRGRR
jgi:hypothetical protein